MKIKNNLLYWRGIWRTFWGWCPKCNSDAPELYKCNICNYNKIKERIIKIKAYKLELTLNEYGNSRCKN
jgi:hypothetical protein